MLNVPASIAERRETLFSQAIMEANELNECWIRGKGRQNERKQEEKKEEAKQIGIALRTETCNHFFHHENREKNMINLTYG